MQIYQASCFRMIQMLKKFSLLGLCLCTKRVHCWHPSIFIALLSSILICRSNCDMHPYSTKSHYVKYAGLFTSAYAIDTILSGVLVFHCHHQSLYWRRFLPKSTLHGWLWSYGIWCYTINSRWGAKYIYNKDQHANTYVSVCGLFPVDKIWSSHSTIKSRFDKPQQSWSPSNFLELPHWVPLHRFRWKSRIHLESFYCF